MNNKLFLAMLLFLPAAAFSQNWSLNGNTPNAIQFLGTTNASDLRFFTSNLPRMVLTSNGRLGLGTKTPTGLLHVQTSSETRAGYFNNAMSSNQTTFGIYAETNNSTNNAVERAAHLYAQGANGYNYGLWSEARNGATNYGIYTLGVSEAGKSAYGIYSQVSGGGNNYAGYFKGGQVYVSHKLGIMDETPGFPLDFGAAYGDKVSFYSANHFQNWHYGIGVQQNKFQFFTNGSQADFVFGIGNSDNFTERMRLMGTGQLLINTTEATGNYKLFVKGKAIFEEVKVELAANWPDYVFSPDYQLPSLAELARHIEEKGHLPGVPSAREVQENGGIELGAMNQKLLEKIEELTLYILELEKRLSAVERKPAAKE